MNMLFDTHAHYDNELFDDDRHELLTSMHDRCVELIVNVGCDIETSKFSVELAEKYPFIYAAAGIHPNETSAIGKDDFDTLSTLLDHPKVVALGEIGLDYHFDFSPKEMQKDYFDKQLSLAENKNMPIIIHEREASQDCFDILSTHKCYGVYHCYSGSVEMAKRIMNLGFYFSFTGVVTFSNARKAQEVVKFLPIERIMLETDCPFMAPVPFRGKRNHSAYTLKIAEKIAELKGLETDEVIRITTQNGKKLFSIT